MKSKSNFEMLTLKEKANTYTALQEISVSMKDMPGPFFFSRILGRGVFICLGFSSGCCLVLMDNWCISTYCKNTSYEMPAFPPLFVSKK